MMKLIVATLNSPDRGEAFFDDIRNVLALEETCKEASYDYMGVLLDLFKFNAGKDPRDGDFEEIPLQVYLKNEGE